MSVRSRYRAIARYYDVVYRLPLARGSRVMIGLDVPRPGQRVLELGSGTGFGLPHYPPGVRVTGVDICPEMLAVAACKRLPKTVARIDLVTMDGHALAIRDAVFDLVLFPHSLGLMQDPPRVLAEVARVARPQAELRILHTFEWRNPLAGRVELALYDLFEDRLGWGRPLQFDRTLRWCHKVGFELTEERRFGWKKILVFRKE